MPIKNYIQGAEYLLKTSMGDTTVVCNRVYDNGSVSFFQYAKRGAKTPIARYKMGKDGTIAGFHDLTIEEVVGAPKVATKSKSKSTISCIEKHKHKTLIMKQWKKGVESGWYRGFANFAKGDTIYEELMFLFLIKRGME